MPFHAQAERDDCGPAAMAMMLGWSGLQMTPADVAPNVYTPRREGTLQHDLITAARRLDRLPLKVGSLDHLIAELAAGHPVLVMQNLGTSWWPQWHYAVAIGFDRLEERIILHSGKTESLRLPIDRFDRSWAAANRWALTITPTDRLPAHADEAAVLTAASALERAGRSDAATNAYGALLKRWPDNLEALMGFGNAHYAQGDLDVARTAFRHAVTLHADAAEAWNNLAVTLSDLGDMARAEEAARLAIALGGPHLAAARDTLTTIKAKRS